ncbi:glutamine-hydrolyzing carbamoyl-phosphate synthase small subunit [Zavarzinella formosa]|uniref:glutamine-hydrolyzing carbamoyl-phosphate synthase small subunit n=1 Tax=Zavarzinella formosa TaxID=360055 RepID=UPI00036A7087|nr:glutamine-hydrolyzing carbamoyl-phosphate synthase small subunit [Zavarzinella formosa]
MSVVAKLALEDGTVFTGRSFGHPGESAGEVVFNTSMTGYQEVLTDPSYKGQIVTMTYPLIGNYGITAEDDESAGPHVAGFIVREHTAVPSNFRSQIDLDGYLKKNQIVGIDGIDTRALVRRLRVRGALMGVLSATDLDDVSLIRKAKALAGMEGCDLVKVVTPKAGYDWKQGALAPLAQTMLAASPPATHRVTAIDYGMKWNIPRCLSQAGCEVTVLPGTATAAEVLAQKPDGIFLSNGPGDPAAVGYAIDTVKELLGKKPIFGICLGHQLIGLALGGTTYKLKFGHRGANHPVLNRLTGHVEITTQNHGFAVDMASLSNDVELTHVNLNDQTVEGIRHKKMPVFSVQYHPESSAGPHDSSYLFDDFRKLMG